MIVITVDGMMMVGELVPVTFFLYDIMYLGNFYTEEKRWLIALYCRT